MKVLLFLFVSLLLLLSCQHKNDTQANDENTTPQSVDSIPMATVILWVDKIKSPYTQKKDNPTSARTVKVKANIDSTGKVRILSYVKPQPGKVMNYLKYRLEVFRVTKVMFDSGFIKPGVQYLQLRYVPERMQKHR